MKTKTDRTETALSCLGLTALVVIAAPLAWVVRGWALQVLWAWFVAPPFGLPRLSIGQAIGLSFFVALIVPTLGSASDRKDEKETAAETWTRAFTMIFLCPLLSVFCGWVLLHLPLWGTR